MDQCEDREEGVPPSKSTLCGEHESQTKAQRKKRGRRKKHKPKSEPETRPSPSSVSLKSDPSKDLTINFKVQQSSAAERKTMKDPSSAEEELSKVRSAFIWRVSTELLKQLLEALVSDGVLNELEKEWILEKNPVRADKARCFIDTVKKKGDKACRIMIRHLQTVDLSLFSQLRLYSDPSAQQVGHAWNTSPRRHLRSIPVRCPNHLNLLLSLWWSSGSTLSPFLLAELLTLYLKERPATLPRKPIFAACIRNFILSAFR
uniref:CARD domain-containing protein n=1 Tax=Oreochromis aureus TaxID=47969 RepID=A0A668U6F6_OREAU